MSSMAECGSGRKPEEEEEAVSPAVRGVLSGVLSGGNGSVLRLDGARWDTLFRGEDERVGEEEGSLAGDEDRSGFPEGSNPVRGPLLNTDAS